MLADRADMGSGAGPPCGGAVSALDAADTMLASDDARRMRPRFVAAFRNSAASPRAPVFMADEDGAVGGRLGPGEARWPDAEPSPSLFNTMASSYVAASSALLPAQRLTTACSCGVGQRGVRENS